MRRVNGHTLLITCLRIYKRVTSWKLIIPIPTLEYLVSNPLGIKMGDIMSSMKTEAASVEEIVPRSQWAIFGERSPIDSEPIVPARFPSREAAQKYVKAHSSSLDKLEVRGLTDAGWLV